jgi:hypothetical protein
VQRKFILLKKNIILIFLLITQISSYSTTVTNTPSSYTNNGGDASFGVGNLSSSNNSRNCVNLNKDEDAKGYFRGFGFAIPADAVITNITVTLEGLWGANDQREETKIRLDNGSGKQTQLVDDKTLFDNIESTKNYSSNESGGVIHGMTLVGQLTPTIINGANFGIRIEEIKAKKNGTSFCFDYIAISITYMTTVPVELIDFTARSINGNAILNWSTASEINNDYFLIEKSINGYDFFTAYKVGGNGNSTKIIIYEFIDSFPFTGVSYYRLKQVDINNEFEYSDIVSIYSENQFLVKIYPNPLSTNSFNIEIISDDNWNNVLVVMLNLLGQEIFTKISVRVVGDYIITVDILEKVPSGVYYIQGTNNKYLFKKKILIK